MLLFDIDGVIRDVAGSYRRALAETVHHYSGWRPDPACIDALKEEGRWNNDWEASLELLRRHGLSPLPDFQSLVAVFSGFYFGGDPAGDPAQWRGFIGDEPLLVDRACFAELDRAGIAWGFVSGAEPPSARYVLERRLGLVDPPLVAMGDAPDKPDPTGLLRLAGILGGTAAAPPATVAYLGDTVADVLTVRNARRARPSWRFLSLAVAPPHLHASAQARSSYEQGLKRAGADAVLPDTGSALATLEQLLSAASRPEP
ncbi:TIGR01548 family HAD-type hydrolase [Cyanobium sp. CH-040]|uniref:TIGR01548 family HAD-type hydrolase n=1 Tax=Cyanobium sp. CH-040 TaxID=2823708 RepID=UPI0020CED581|nr:TIGR01548 family HAD-type hydrolase [Cyanobium sp. CH-040]MCP9928065.1 TIGR01548 family HAD-type hydrolase [Cyanobium sp. CH-040]